MVMDVFAGDAAAVLRTAVRVQLSHWEVAARRARAALERGQLVQAHGACRHALRLALELVAMPPAGREDDCLAALVVSHHLLADLHAGEGDIDSAAHCVAQAHERVLALLADASHGVALQQAAWRHSRASHAELLHHVARHGPHVAITQALQSGLQAVGAASGPAPH